MNHPCRVNPDSDQTMIRPNLSVVLAVFLLFILFHFLLNLRQVKIDCDTCLQHCSKHSSSTTPPVIGDQLKPPSLGDSRSRAGAGGAKARAAIVILARNSDFEGLNKTIPLFEKTFNSRFNYPYVFLNDVPFTDDFKSRVRLLSPSQMSFGLVPTEHWSYPQWINTTKADECRQDMERRNIIYGGSLPYRHMCRFNSGFFFKHPLLKDFDYYWRVEPWVEFFCDIHYDPFMYMKTHGKEYGFTIMVPEYIETVPTLWKTTKEFMKEYPSVVHPNNCLEMFTNEDGGYNLCHFWSNFEIGSLNFFRSSAYTKYFEYLDQAGGFFYERWGDAPVHSIAAAMMLPKEKIHWFQDIGYYHAPFYNCPTNPELQLNCNCNPEKSNHHRNGCHDRFFELFRNK